MSAKAVATMAVTAWPMPAATPIAAAIQMLAAVVSPLTCVSLSGFRIAPAQRNQMPDGGP